VYSSVSPGEFTAGAAVPLAGYFLLCRFGPFAGVLSNPTLDLVQNVQHHIKSNPLPQCSQLIDAGELPVSASDMPEALKPMIDRAGPLPERTTRIWVHFGVAASNRKVHIERTAFNDASFGCADNSGNVYSRRPVCAGEPLDARRHPALPLEAVVASLANDGYSVAISDDAGRFLCNYTMYHSLARCHPLPPLQADQSPPLAEEGVTLPAPAAPVCAEETAMFVHVPLHTVLSHEQLLHFASALLAEVGGRVSRAGGLCAMQTKSPRKLFKHPIAEHAADAALASAVSAAQSKSGTAASSAQEAVRPPPPTGASQATQSTAAVSGMLQDLQDMGFGREHALAALAATQYRSIDAALDWAVEHPAFEVVPLPGHSDPPSAGALGDDVSPGDIASAIEADARMQQAAVSTSAAAAEASLQAAATGGSGQQSAAPTAASGSMEPSLAAMLSQWSFDLKLVLLVRQDLRMSTGKVAAQCSHAAIAAATKGDALMSAQWQDAGEKIVVLGVENAQAVQQLSAKARSAGLQVHAITDAGRTEVAPGTQTVTAIGPAFASAIDQVTGHLKTL